MCRLTPEDRFRRPLAGRARFRRALKPHEVDRNVRVHEEGALRGQLGPLGQPYPGEIDVASPAGLAAGRRAKQEHALRPKLREQSLRERLGRLPAQGERVALLRVEAHEPGVR
jgi:hypothetical protein